MAVNEFVDSAIADNTVAIFSKSYCPYCKSAKKLFADKYPTVKTTVYELDERDDGSEIQDYLYEKTGQRTVPNVFITGKHIGGSDDLADAHNENKIAPLLA
ncbi:glutaredoxin [Cyathus striatus]|nr:glutaredoxin [Cyathus striatus]